MSGDGVKEERIWLETKHTSHLFKLSLNLELFFGIPGGCFRVGGDAVNEHVANCD